MNSALYTSSENQQPGFSRPAAGDGGTYRFRDGTSMVCLDVDGTIVHHDGFMSEAVKNAGRELVAAGHTVVVSTGRSLHSALPVVETFGITSGYAVCSNGGVTVRIDAENDDPNSPGYEVISQQVFDPSKALYALSERLPTARFALETSAGHFLSTERFEDLTFGMIPEPVSFKDLTQAQAVRLVVKSDDSTAQDFADMVQDIGLHGVSYSVGWSAWLDISADGVTKGAALEHLREQIGAPREATVACGDGRNDIEMLRWAQRGVAMGQSVQEVIDAADEVTGTVEDDGLVSVLESVMRP